jgi:DNA-binding GntR family transcriptional regulator
VASLRGLTENDLDEIYQMREVLEPLAARLAAARITQPALDELRGHIVCTQRWLRMTSLRRTRPRAHTSDTIGNASSTRAGNRRLAS